MPKAHVSLHPAPAVRELGYMRHLTTPSVPSPAHARRKVSACTPAKLLNKDQKSCDSQEVLADTRSQSISQETIKVNSPME